MRPKTPPTKKIEQHPDAWRRFESAVDAAVKGGPKHRPSKPPAAKREVPKKAPMTVERMPIPYSNEWQIVNDNGDVIEIGFESQAEAEAFAAALSR